MIHWKEPKKCKQSYKIIPQGPTNKRYNNAYRDEITQVKDEQASVQQDWIFTLIILEDTVVCRFKPSCHAI